MAKTTISAKNIKLMPTAMLGVTAMYVLGIDLKSKLSEPTWYKYKSALKAYGYDISEPIN